MFWADKLLENRKDKEWINDAWTPSGIIHMGGLKGPVIHDVIFKVLKEKGSEAKFTFGFDDMDAIDGLPVDLQEKLGQYMGIPIAYAPSPDGQGTFGEYYANIMRDLFKILDIQAEIYLASDYYKQGVYDKAIRFVLDNAEKIRQVYSQMYHKEIADNWFPLQVVCPNCGKVGTTTVIGWDGNEVAFECSVAKVKWAKGCELKGSISPFGGNATMPFKVEWAAKWWTFGVTIEGAGKDHASAGGTYDVARKIIKDVFETEPPLRLPYEFFLYDGKKMSSSKGLGLTAQDLLEVIPPQMFRFLMLKTEPNTTVEFNPFGTLIIPKLYEDYMRAAEEHMQNPNSEMGRAFELSQIGELEYPPQFRFLTLSQWVQMPNMDGEIEKEGLSEWAKYAKVWIEKYAPENDKFEIKKDLPAETKNLSKEQKVYLKIVSERFEEATSEVDLLAKLYRWRLEGPLTSNQVFQALYIALIGKDHGPKAASLIRSLDANFVKERLQEASS